MQLSKDQVNTILKNAPQGADKTKILDGLISKGYELEGVDTNQAKLDISKRQNDANKQDPTYLQRVGTDIKNNLTQAKTDITSNDNRSSLSKGVSAISNIASAVTAPLSEAPVFKQIGEVIKKGVELGGEELAKLYTPEFQAKLASLSDEEFKQATQPLQDLVNTGNIANTLLMAKGGQKTANLVKDTAIKTGEKVNNIIDSVAENSIKYPNKIVESISDKITKIDPQTKNILETASLEKFDNYVKAGEEALKNPRLLTPLEQAGEKVNTQILPVIKEDLNRIGSQKAKSLESVKNVQVPDATTEAIQFVKDSIKNSKLTKEETKLIKETISQMELGKSPTLGTLDKTVDLLQNTLFEKAKGLAIPVTSRVESIVNQAIGKLNNKVKTATEKALNGSKEYNVLNDAYATKIELFNKLNKAIGEDAQKGGSLFKKFFSPQDSGTKKLFADIKEQYGIDLAEDATLAKFVMDSLGDTRAKSLLEQVPISKAGIVTKTLQNIENKLTRPIPKARGIIKKRPQEKLK